MDALQAKADHFELILMDAKFQQIKATDAYNKAVAVRDQLKQQEALEAQIAKEQAQAQKAKEAAQAAKDAQAKADALKQQANALAQAAAEAEQIAKQSGSVVDQAYAQSLRQKANEAQAAYETVAQAVAQLHDEQPDQTAKVTSSSSEVVSLGKDVAVVLPAVKGKNSTASLPKTGVDNHNDTAAGYGILAMLLGMLGLGTFYKKRQN